MTATVPADWDDMIETLRIDLETVSSGDAEDEEVRDAIEEVWAIVDAAEERIGSVDADEIGEALGVDADAVTEVIDVDSIDRELVSDDPERAAGLGRLVALINLDESTEYDVGRLWRDGEGVEGEADVEESAPGDGEEPETEPKAADESGRSTDDHGEQLRAQLGDALSQLRDRIQDARGDIEGSTERGGEEGASEAESREDDRGQLTGRRSKSSSRSATPLSTIPSERHDMGGVARISTMPGRRGRSRRSTGSDSNEEGDE